MGIGEEEWKPHIMVIGSIVVVFVEENKKIQAVWCSLSRAECTFSVQTAGINTRVHKFTMAVGRLLLHLLGR